MPGTEVASGGAWRRPAPDSGATERKVDKAAGWLLRNVEGRHVRISNKITHRRVCNLERFSQVFAGAIQKIAPEPVRDRSLGGKRRSRASRRALSREASKAIVLRRKPSGLV